MFQEFNWKGSWVSTEGKKLIQEEIHLVLKKSNWTLNCQLKSLILSKGSIIKLRSTKYRLSEY